MKIVHGAVVAALLVGAPLAAQQHDHHAAQDSSAAQHGCMGMSMMGAKDSAGMAGMHGMTGMMAPDSAMMTAMRFAPRGVLAHREALDLSADQVRQIEALAPMPADTAPMAEMKSGEQHRDKMLKAAAAVRELLTPDQREKVKALPAPCGMMGR